MAYTKVAVAGATGNLGPAVVKELLAAGLEVTVLSASGNTSALPSEIKAIKVDYSSKASVVSALKGQEAFVSLIPKFEEQPALIDAAIEAGVKRFLPSEFGSNTSGNDRVAKLPVYGGKILTQEYLKKNVEKISYTLVHNGIFFDWALQVGFIVNFKGKTTLYDGGDGKFSTSTLSDIGKAVVGILKHPEETKNRTVYIQSAALSQNDLIAAAQRAKPEFQIEKEDVKAADLEQKGYELLQKGGENIWPAMITFVTLSIFGDEKEWGNNWSGKNDNELLGIREKSQQEIEEIVKQYL